MRANSSAFARRTALSPRSGLSFATLSFGFTHSSTALQRRAILSMRCLHTEVGTLLGVGTHAVSRTDTQCRDDRDPVC